jgi:hypothetical protein
LAIALSGGPQHRTENREIVTGDRLSYRCVMRRRWKLLIAASLAVCLSLVSLTGSGGLESGEVIQDVLALEDAIPADVPTLSAPTSPRAHPTRIGQGGAARLYRADVVRGRR